MLPLISVVFVILGALGFRRLLPRNRKRRRQVRFIRETLAANRTFDNRRVIVSLSTVPDRISNLRPTLRSLLKQTRLPDEIVLAAGRQNTLIMVVDDDRVYPPDALETYLHYSEQLPEAALCFRGAAMPSTLDWDDATMIRASDLREPRPVAVITGCGSYLVQPRFFDESLWDYSVAPQIAFHIDDIWIRGWLSLRGVKRYVVPASAMMRSVLRQRWTVSLNKIPGRQKLNNEIIAFFRETWDVFALG